MRKVRSAPSAFLLAGAILTGIGCIFLPIGIGLRAVDALFFYAFGAVGAVLLGVGLALLYVWYTRRKTAESVKAAGHYVLARIVNISRNYSVTINGVNPYVIECVFQDPDTGISHNFRSGDLMEDPSASLNSDEIRVYINPDNLDEYYVDIDSITSQTVYH